VGVHVYVRICVWDVFMFVCKYVCGMRVVCVYLCLCVFVHVYVPA